MPNRLIHATSPYLLQHAHNPVDWYEWGPEAMERARTEDKPMLVSIGYSSCHWCHVMEHESFENEDIAQIMNEHFICIKVDREERPDVDHIYMEALQAMGQNGGWPLNVFLTPQQQPFYGGTYFPPRNWAQLLLKIHQAFGEQRDKIESSAADLTAHLQISDVGRFGNHEGQQLARRSLDTIFEIIESKFDPVYGGMDKAPKFVMPTIWQYLLRYFHLTKNPDAVNMVQYTLEKMARGGIYDQVVGGFARYSVDARWFAPHFEKMLYDNAQLLSLYAEAYLLTKEPLLKSVLEETIHWLETEMLHPEGGFYSALDADSEGVEGKYYTWTMDEWRAALEEEADRAGLYFGVTMEGNWEYGRNILTTDKSRVADTHDIVRWKARLAQAQKTRVRPGLDDKILAGWNAMTAKGLLDAYQVLENVHYLNLAINCIRFIEEKMMNGQQLCRSYKERASSVEAFLEDYAYLIQAYTHLYQVTFDEPWLTKAGALLDYVVLNFLDSSDGFFHYSSQGSERLIARKKEIFDNVIPSSNSLMARNLLHLGTLLDRDDWKEKSLHMVRTLSPIIEKEPSYLSHWGIALAEWVHGLHEVAIAGPAAHELRKELNKIHLPFALNLGTTSSSNLPLLKDKVVTNGESQIFVCKDKVCQLPVHTVAAAVQQLQ